MARSEARIFTIVWRDPNFRALPQSAQWLYMFLLSQDDLEYSGLIPLRPRRWTSSANDLTSEGLHRDLLVLQAARFVLVDFDTDEVFVRALMRRDEVWKQWTILKAAHTSTVQLRSVTIRVGLAEELARIEGECMVTGKAVLVLKEFMKDFPQVKGPEKSLPDKSFIEAFAERSLSGGEGGRVSTTPTGTAVVAVGDSLPDKSFNVAMTTGGGKQLALPVAAATGDLTITQRSKMITDTYSQAEPMCRWPAVNGVVIKAIKTGRWADQEITDALLRLAKEGRSVTVDSLRTELNGFTPYRRPGTEERIVKSVGSLYGTFDDSERKESP